MGRPEDREAPCEWGPDLITAIGVELGVSNPTGNIEDLIKRGEELCECLTVCTPSSPSGCVMTHSVQRHTPFPSQGGYHANQIKYPIAPTVLLGRDVSSIYPLSDQGLRSEGNTTGAVSTDITRPPTPSHSLLNVRRAPPLSRSSANKFVLGPRYTVRT